MFQYLGRQQVCFNEHAAPINTLKNKHNSVDYYKEIKLFADGFVISIHIDGTKNPLDILTVIRPK